MLSIPFTKACALGNDFVFLPIQDLPKGLCFEKLSKIVSDRRYGIGCDQILFFSKKETGHYNVRFFNQDGSEAEACFNGTRALGKYLIESDDIDKLTLETCVTQITLWKDGEDIISSHTLGGQTESMTLKGYEQIHSLYVDVGNPHIILLDGYDDVNGDLGHALEHHEAFPNRTNVSFAKVLSNYKVDLNVWERGVGFTPACGTGACATALAVTSSKLCDFPVQIQQPGGTLEINRVNNAIHIKGTAFITFSGSLSLSETLFTNE